MPESPKKAERKPAEHPKYSEMALAALGALKERNGSSRKAILKYIQANYKVKSNAKVYLKNTLRRMVADGKLLQPKGISGSYKLVKVEKPKKAAKKPAAKPAAKKPAAKKPAAKKAVKKPAAKKAATKSPKKAKKPAAKKATTKKAAKPAKKPAAKKPTKKPAAKKPAKKTAKK